MRRLFGWPYWLPVIGGARGWAAAGYDRLITAAAALGIYRSLTPSSHIADRYPRRG